MIPVVDVIPTRTAPVVTLALIALSVVIGTWVAPTGIVFVIADLVCLWLFGWTTEDRLGHGRFAICYAICGSLAWLLGAPHLIIDAGVGGVIGAYIAMYPQSVMLVLVPMPALLVEAPALVFAGLWYVLQILHLAAGVSTAAVVLGFALCFVLRRRERLRVDWWSPRRNGPHV